MPPLNRHLPPVPINQFGMVPRSDVPRSVFPTTHTVKTTFSATNLIPVMVKEMLPGDHIAGDVTMFLRMATPLFPIMDNLYLDSFFFFTPCRILWDNWVKFMGEQKSPADSISYTIPLVTSTATGFANLGLADYFGLPVQGGAVTVALGVNAIPFRAYNRIFNEWFRDENLVAAAFEYTGDASQTEATNYGLKNRAKRPDYFTSALPWPQKGGTAVTIPLGTLAPVRTAGSALVTGTQVGMATLLAASGGAPGTFQVGTNAGALSVNTTAFAGTPSAIYPSNLYADLSTATSATINSLRLAVASQQFLEKDARGGTRYAELLRNHFGVTPQDARLDRPEYIGGGTMPITTQAIPQTSATGLTGGSSYIGSLGGATVGSGRHRFSYAAQEHGYILGLVNVRADITYQQGIRRMWTRSTRFDFYFPTFAFLGEQAIRNDEIYATGVVAVDTAAFGYQERWAEYRTELGMITGKFRSYPTSGSLAAWHLAQAFASAPSLNEAFIQDASFTTVERAVAAGAAAASQQFLFDSVFHLTTTRPLPVRSVPGLMRF